MGTTRRIGPTEHTPRIEDPHRQLGGDRARGEYPCDRGSEVGPERDQLVVAVEEFQRAVADMLVPELVQFEELDAGRNDLPVTGGHVNVPERLFDPPLSGGVLEQHVPEPLWRGDNSSLHAPSRMQEALPGAQEGLPVYSNRSSVIPRSRRAAAADQRGDDVGRRLFLNTRDS